MILGPPSPTRTHTPIPYTTLFPASTQTLKLFVDRDPVPVPDYCARTLALGGEGTSLRPDPDLVQDWIGKGASVILNDIDALAPGVRQLANELQEATGGRSQANLYFSMSKRQAFGPHRSEEHTSELQSLMRISYAVFCLKKKTHKIKTEQNRQNREYE